MSIETNSKCVVIRHLGTEPKHKKKLFETRRVVLEISDQKQFFLVYK